MKKFRYKGTGVLATVTTDYHTPCVRIHHPAENIMTTVKIKHSILDVFVGRKRVRVERIKRAEQRAIDTLAYSGYEEVYA